MNENEKSDLYDDIDGCDELSDSEKRDAYFSEIEERENQEDWER